MEYSEVNKMLFNEVYSVYYNTVAKIIEQAFNSKINSIDLQRIIAKYAFKESSATISPSLIDGDWPFLDKQFNPLLRHKPTMPLTTLQKKWLKAISLDPRIKLFGVKIDDLDDVTPLFTYEDFKVYDRYGDGDNFEDEKYISNFRYILNAINQHKLVKVEMYNRARKKVWLTFYPIGFEYSQKDDKIRVITSGYRYKQFNLGRVVCCSEGDEKYLEEAIEDPKKTLTLTITDERSALERAMLHFAHFEKKAKRISDNTYSLEVVYNASDESEMIIRVLSFGPFLKVEKPYSFVQLIKERLEKQKSCQL